MDTIKVNPYHVTDVVALTIGGKAQILTAAEVPGTLVPDFVGQIYIDTENAIAYIAISVEASGFTRVTNP